jgi:hypothetical protein
VIVCEEYGFCFLHIPKCGGSTVREQIASLDSFGGEFGGFHGITHAISDGPQQKAHLPIREIEFHFPEVYERIVPLEKFAIVRDPHQRFLSAFSQRAREVHGRFVGEMSNRAIQEDFAVIRAHLHERPDLPSFPFRHFVRQVAFTHHEGRPFVDHVVPLERIGELIDHLSIRTGQPLVREFHSNKTITFRHPSTKTSLVSLKDLVKRYAPLPVYNRLKEAGLKLFTVQGFPRAVLDVLDRANFRDFVYTHYAEDFEVRALANTHNTLKVPSDAH